MIETPAEIPDDGDPSATSAAGPPSAARRGGLRQSLRRSVFALLLGDLAVVVLGTTQASTSSWTQTSSARGQVSGQVYNGWDYNCAIHAC